MFLNVGNEYDKRGGSFFRSFVVPRGILDTCHFYIICVSHPTSTHTHTETGGQSAATWWCPGSFWDDLMMIRGIFQQQWPSPLTVYICVYTQHKPFLFSASHCHMKITRTSYTVTQIKTGLGIFINKSIAFLISMLVKIYLVFVKNNASFLNLYVSALFALLFSGIRSMDLHQQISF